MLLCRHSIRLCSASRGKPLDWEDGHVEELLASGTVGLLEAANLYNGQYRFSTYASYCVFKRMLEYVRLIGAWFACRSLRRGRLRKRIKSRPHIPTRQ